MSQFDTSRIESLVTLMGDNFSSLVDMYENNAKENIEKLKQALAEEARLQAIHAAHGLKGCSGNIGASRLFNLCETLEQASEHGDFAALREHLNDIQTELEETVIYLKKVCIH